MQTKFGVFRSLFSQKFDEISARNFVKVLANFRSVKRNFAVILAKFHIHWSENSCPWNFARVKIRIGNISTKRNFAGNGSGVVVKTLCSDRCVCYTCTCDCFKQSLQIESSSMLVIVKLTLVKELTEKRKMNVGIFIFSILCDISERDKRYTTKYANNE